MKPVINRTIGLLVVAIAFIACSKDNDDTGNPVAGGGGGGGSTSGALLLIEERVDGQPELKFEYDEQNRMTTRYVYTADGNIHTDNFTYDSNNRMVGVVNSAGLKESYSYAEGNRPSSGTFVGPSGVITTIQFTYSQNTVTETHTTEDQAVTFTYQFDSKGNLTSVMSAAIGVESLIEFGDYDDKKTAYTQYPWSWKIGYVNNYQSVKTTALGTTATDRVLEYTYNDAGYPVKAEEYDRASKELVLTREYFYKDAN